MMMIEQRLYRKGEFVELVDLSQFGPREVPIPARWYVLRIQPSREFKVMKTFEQRNISAYLPISIRTIARDTRKVARRPHMGRTVVEALFPGLIFIPDFECMRDYRVLSVDGVAGFLRFGECYPYLKPDKLCEVRALETAATVPLKERKRLYQLGQLVRIVDGPLCGFEGRIDRLDSKGRLRVLIDALKRGAKVSITEAQIEPALASTDA